VALMSHDSEQDQHRQFPVAHVVVAVCVLLALAVIIVPLALPRRRYGSSNEARAIGALKTIATSQAIFREGDKEQDGNLDYGMLSELGGPNIVLVDSVLASGTRQGYLFQASYGFNTSEFLWFAVANPAIPGTTGHRSFCTNQAGMIYYRLGSSLSLDTNSCTLPAGGVVPTGK
jgi:hypothetical protein